MLPPIQVQILLNAPVTCARPGCNHWVEDQQNAVFVARHLMVVAYCSPYCYLETWRWQLETQDPVRARDDALESLGYYNEKE